MRATSHRLMSPFLVRMVQKIQTDEQTSMDSLTDQFSNQEVFPKHVSSFQCTDSGSRPLEGILKVKKASRNGWYNCTETSRWSMIWNKSKFLLNGTLELRNMAIKNFYLEGYLDCMKTKYYFILFWIMTLRLSRSTAVCLGFFSFDFISALTNAENSSFLLLDVSYENLPGMKSSRYVYLKFLTFTLLL